MKTNEQISKIIRDNYPSRGDIKEPKLEIFTSGEMYTSDPNFWENMVQSALELGKLSEETARKIEEWDEENLPNLLWLGKIRLFLTNRAIIFGWEGDVFKEVKLTKLNLALLHLFLNHDGVLDKSDLCEAKKELQSIYTRIGREESEQFKDKEEDELYRGNDWFSKLVTEFNRDSLEVSERDWGRLPDHYGIKIITRNAKHDFERSKEHDYELVIPFEVHLGKEALKNFKAELNKREKDIERERTLVNPIREQRQRVWDSALERAQNSGMIESALKLGNAISQKKPSEFEKWYRNDNLRRLLVSYDTRQYYLVQNGKETQIELPAQQLALVLLFSRHLDGITMQQIRQDKAITSELNDIYHLIKRSAKKDLSLDSLDESHPNAKLMDLISRINKNGFSIRKVYESDGLYSITGIHELIELSLE